MPNSACEAPALGRLCTVSSLRLHRNVIVPSPGVVIEEDLLLHALNIKADLLPQIHFVSASRESWRHQRTQKSYITTVATAPIGTSSRAIYTSLRRLRCDEFRSQVIDRGKHNGQLGLLPALGRWRSMPPADHHAWADALFERHLRIGGTQQIPARGQLDLLVNWRYDAVKPWRRPATGLG